MAKGNKKGSGDGELPAGKSDRAILAESLETVVREVGLAGRPSIDDEVSYLIGRLGTSELASVVKLLAQSLLLTHRADHLPTTQAWQAIRDAWVGPGVGESSGSPSPAPGPTI